MPRHEYSDNSAPRPEAQTLEPQRGPASSRGSVGKTLEPPRGSTPRGSERLEILPSRLDPPTAGYSALCRHLRGEAIVFKRVRWYLVPSILIGVYWFLIVFRRTAFFVERFGLENGTLNSGPLYDLGSAFFTKLFGIPDMAVPDPDPAIQQKNIDRIIGFVGATDTFMGAISAMIFLCPFASWYTAWVDGKIPDDPVYAANFFNRYVFVLILGHFMRFVSYTSTVLPGPSYHCRPEFIQQVTGIAYMDLLPKNAYSIFFPSVDDMKNVSLNCGDLLFSGHMYTNVISWYYFVCYSKRVFTKPGWGLLSRRIRLVLIGLHTFCLVGCAVCILASRQHYTVDILLGTYIGVLLPYWYDRNLAPAEIDPYSSER